jgi:hypothetical protein
MEVGNQICSLGHIGALCESCDLYNVRGKGTYAISGKKSIKLTLKIIKLKNKYLFFFL